MVKKRNPFVAVEKKYNIKRFKPEPPIIELSDEDLMKKIKLKCKDCDNEIIENYFLLEKKEQSEKLLKQQILLQQQKEKNEAFKNSINIIKDNKDLIENYPSDKPKTYIKLVNKLEKRIINESKLLEDMIKFKNECKIKWCKKPITNEKNTIPFYKIELLVSPETTLKKSELILLFEDKKTSEKIVISPNLIEPIDKLLKDISIDKILTDKKFCETNNCKDIIEEFKIIHPDFIPELKTSSNKQNMLIFIPKKDSLPFNFKQQNKLNESIILKNKNDLRKIKSCLSNDYIKLLLLNLTHINSINKFETMDKRKNYIEEKGIIIEPKIFSEFLKQNIISNSSIDHLKLPQKKEDVENTESVIKEELTPLQEEKLKKKRIRILSSLEKKQYINQPDYIKKNNERLILEDLKRRLNEDGKNLSKSQEQKLQNLRDYDDFEYNTEIEHNIDKFKINELPSLQEEKDIEFIKLIDKKSILLDRFKEKEENIPVSVDKMLINGTKEEKENLIKNKLDELKIEKNKELENIQFDIYYFLLHQYPNPNSIDLETQEKQILENIRNSSKIKDDLETKQIQLLKEKQKRETIDENNLKLLIDKY